jgi:hypothetical protein
MVKENYMKCIEFYEKFGANQTINKNYTIKTNKSINKLKYLKFFSFNILCFVHSNIGITFSKILTDHQFYDASDSGVKIVNIIQWTYFYNRKNEKVF